MVKRQRKATDRERKAVSSRRRRREESFLGGGLRIKPAEERQTV